MKSCKHCIINKEKYPEFKHCPNCGKYIGELSNGHVATETSIDTLNNINETHPSYAQISFSRVTGGKCDLYGSSIKHQNFIKLRISQSTKYFNEYDEGYKDATTPLIEVDMSHSQFSEAITSLNLGCGVPVTLRKFAGEVMPMCPEYNIREKISDDLESVFKEFSQQLGIYGSELDDILNKHGAINKKERNKILRIFEDIKRKLEADLPFLHRCIDEAVDKTTVHAKGEIEAFFNNKISQLGLSKFKSGDIKMLTNSNTPPDFIK